MTTTTDGKRIREMLRGRRSIRVVPFPSMLDEESPPQVGVQILLERDIDACREEAAQYVQIRARERKLSAAEWMMIDAEVLDREVQRQLVYRAFVEVPDDPDNPPPIPKPFFQSPAEVRQLDTEVFNSLWWLYRDHQDYVNPLFGIDDAGADAIVEALGKGQRSEVVLGLYDAPTLRRFVHSLAARLAKSPTGS